MKTNCSLNASKYVGLLALAAGGLTSVAAAQPANDRVENATPVSFPLNTILGTTVGASNEGAIPALTSCGNSTTVAGVQALINADIQGSRDVWYLLTTPGTLVANTSLAASTCGPDTTSDTVVEVYAVGAGNTLGARITCDDDTCLNRKSRATFTAQPNTSYYIRVATRNDTQGPFGVNVLFNTDPRPVDTAISFGPDVTIGDIADLQTYGTGTVAGVNVRAFAVGTDSWNIGDRPADWFDYNINNLTFRPIGAPAGTLITRSKASNEHPVIAQQMYRYANGQFQQIGISWLKHGFTSTNSTRFNLGIAYPSNTTRTCAGSTGHTSAQSITGQGYSGGDFLVINCGDLYGASLNGSQGNLGPRYDVNALNGVYTHPYTALVPGVSNTTIDRRLLVPVADWANPGARYFVDAVYITSDDNKWNNGLNNYSSREFRTITTTGAQTPASGTATFQPVNTGTPTGAATMRRRPAIHFWKEIDPSVKLVNADFVESSATIEDMWGWPTQNRTFDLTGRYTVASKVTDNGDGTYTYRYAVMNVNSHRSADSFAIRMPGTATVSNGAWQGPFHHSGDRVDTSPWNFAKVDNFMKFDTNMNFTVARSIGVDGDPNTPGTQPVNFMSNALRWGVMHNYSFTTTVPPTTGYAKIKLEKAPASGAGFQGSYVTVNGIDVPTVANIADVAGLNQAPAGDGQLTADDIIVYLGAFFANDALVADVAGLNQSTIPDGALTADDIIVFLNAYFGG